MALVFNTHRGFRKEPTHTVTHHHRDRLIGIAVLVVMAMLYALLFWWAIQGSMGPDFYRFWIVVI